jgi:hypothetical protein
MGAPSAMPRSLKALGIVLLIAGLAAYALRDRRSSPVPQSQASEAAAARPVHQPQPPASPAPVAPRAAQAVMGEASLMAKLRELGQSAPAQTLDLARAGNARFPGSPDAPERAWFVVRSLANLQRFHEARDEARIMKEKYPGTSWALDAEQHLLLYPLDQPSREEQQEQDQ